MTTSHDELKIQPSWQFLFSHPAHLLSFGFGAGLAKKAPGTWGTLVAFPLYGVLASLMSEPMLLLVIVCAFVAGIGLCQYTSNALGGGDYGGIVWDEIAAFMLVLFFTPAGFLWQVLAFVLFRFFDIWKPQPIRHFDAEWHGGLGIMFDDLLAAGYALLCLAVIKAALT